ncbi:MAG: 3-methyladenine DNA glycosylase, partial [Gemmatimonadota bacterium]|nr:3-methyladenine DNA glycosylase [Gemmatimonadota bacterium]
MVAPKTLSAECWRPLTEAHAARVARWTEPRRQRRARQRTHPVYDFLFDYYRYSTAKLTEWHP